MEPTGFAQKKTYGNSVKRDARSFSPIPPNNNGGFRSDLSRIDRMYQSNKKQKTSVSDSGPPKILSNKLVKIQKDYFTKYENLIKWEIEDQMKEIEQRISKWDRKRLMKEGVSLFDMKASFRGYLFNETLMSFRPISGEMPYHKFAHGDMVLISSPKNAAKPITFDGVIAEKTKTYITLATSYPIRTSDLEPGIWRLDQTANRVTFDRMLNALKLFTSSDGEKLTSFKDLILGNVKSIPDSAKQSPPMYLASSYLQSNWPRDFPTWKLNTSQRNVIKQALTRRLTIIQGPPGTGKTHTAVHLIKLIVYCLQRLNRKVHILCTADTNVAVDNLLEGLTDQGVRALRVGKPVKIREELRGLCLDAKLLEHDESSKVEKLREEMNTFLLQGNASAANRIKSDIRSIEMEISKDIMSNCEVICATCIGASAELLEGYKFPVVLIDECTQATEPAALCALVKGSEHVILLGDHFQLPPTVTSERAQKGGLSMSIFERLINQGVEPCLLQIQYRMHPAISEFPSREFYDNKITDGLSAEDRPMPAGFPWPNEQKPVSFIAMDEGEEQVSFDGLSKQNLVEAEKVIEVIDEFLQSGFTPKDIGIITPYNGQVQLLKNLLGTKGGTSKGQKYHKLTVHSVDGFQGREKEIIVFSAVRANKEKNVGFLRDWRRLNVALTRARRGIIILGHTETLSSDTHWNKWLHWIKDNHLQLHMNKMKEINTE